ncbi:lysophospholipid acyltransferase family protein [Lichenicoccus roseus]|uniref:1-acyl-sn-glycerol-3-phosphate acyltransferase n=1 Tax=Lichenicoccus roseus TaxID=2683649 RepID=A0A5R9J597_9PROT|nr:lysophospholipid acyltransferase family protein [Lichenicoccus roseus]TLU72033.1 1-acyl-sn-glycerol-3-phosphate acyltransferase [Lichenicoccus roseus]
MQAAPRRLGRRTGQHGVSDIPLKIQAKAHGRVGTPPSFDHPGDHPVRLPPARRLLRRIRVIRRGLVIISWTGIGCLVQSALLGLPGRGKARFARTYWAMVCRLLGLQVRVIGEPVGGTGERPVVYASNHSSWLDVPVLGGRLLACFVSKDDVSHWPVVGQVARLGRTIFVSRQRGTTGRERDAMRHRLGAGDDLILFPEGTSSDGCRVLAFHSSFFAAAKPSGVQPPGAIRPLVQPVSVVYDRLAGLPVNHARRPVFSWYGDMDLASHFWQLAQWRTMRATVLLHPPLDPADFPTRKELAQATWDAVAAGAAELRQNRPVLVPARLPRPAVAAGTPSPAERPGHPVHPRPSGHSVLDKPTASFA